MSCNNKDKPVDLKYDPEKTRAVDHGHVAFFDGISTIHSGWIWRHKECIDTVFHPYGSEDADSKWNFDQKSCRKPDTCDLFGAEKFKWELGLISFLDSSKLTWVGSYSWHFETCLRKFELCRKRLPQSGQWYGISPVCNIICRLSELGWVKDLWHSRHVTWPLLSWPTLKTIFPNSTFSNYRAGRNDRKKPKK